MGSGAAASRQGENIDIRLVLGDQHGSREDGRVVSKLRATIGPWRRDAVASRLFADVSATFRIATSLDGMTALLNHSTLSALTKAAQRGEGTMKAPREC